MFPKNSSFAEQHRVWENERTARALAPKEPLGKVASVPHEELDRWSRELDSLALMIDDPDALDYVEEVRDQVHSYLRG